MRIAKMRYELLGEDPVFIATDLGLSLTSLRDNIENQKWRQLAIAELLPDPSAENFPVKAEDAAKDLAATYKSKITLLSLVKADYFNNRCTVLEYLLLIKTQEALSQLDTEDDNAHTRLKVLSGVVASIRDAQMYSEMKDKISEDMDQIRVNIIQNFGDSCDNKTIGNA
jgi:hypothetical protein